MSSFFNFRRASMSFGRITPTELPICMSLRAAIAGSNVITRIAVSPGSSTAAGRSRAPLGARPPTARPRIQYHPCDDPKEDPDAYDYQMKEHLYLQRVHEHIDSGAKSGVRSTPGFFVNGAVEDVSFGLDRLEKAVKAALGK